MSTTNVNEMLAGREARYGTFEGHAKIAQGLKAVMHERSGWDGLADDQKEALEMIQHKNGWKEGASHLWASDRKQTTILEFDKPSRNGEHPTMKPVALFEYQMLNNTKGGDLVLDSFGGSGTTLIAAEKNGRTALLMELDPRYCDVIVKRWQAFTGQQAIHAETGKPFAEVKDGNKEAKT